MKKKTQTSYFTNMQKVEEDDVLMLVLLLSVQISKYFSLTKWIRKTQTNYFTNMQKVEEDDDVLMLVLLLL